MRQITLYTICFILFVIVSLSTLFNVELFSIKQIDVRNNRIVDSQSIQRIMNPAKGENIFRLNKKQFTEKLKNIIQIENVKVEIKLPHTLKVLIKERKPWGHLLINRKSIIIDYYGVILNKDHKYNIDPSDLPLIKINDTKLIKDNRVDMGLVNNIKDILDPLKKIFKPNDLNINITKMNNIEVLADDILLIKLGNMENIKSKFKTLHTLLEHIDKKWTAIEYINIKSHKNPTVKYKK